MWVDPTDIVQLDTTSSPTRLLLRLAAPAILVLGDEPAEGPSSCLLSVAAQGTYGVVLVLVPSTFGAWPPKQEVTWRPSEPKPCTQHRHSRCSPHAAGSSWPPSLWQLP